MVSSSKWVYSPVRIGRLSSFAAAKTVWLIMSRDQLGGQHNIRLDGFGDRREFARADALDIRVGHAAAHVDRLRRFVEQQINALRREVADQFGEGLRRERDRAGAIHLRADVGRDAHFQIGRGKLQASIFGCQQDVRQNRQRGALSTARLTMLKPLAS